MKMFKGILEVLFWIVFTAGLVFLLSFTGRNHENIDCKGISITIDHDGTEEMLGEETIRNVVLSVDDSIEHCKISAIPITRIYNVIYKNKAIKQMHIYAGLDGSVNIRITQRKPVLKIISPRQALYIDDEHMIFEARSGEAARVIVASGSIAPIVLNESGMVYIDTLENKQYTELFMLSECIRNDKFLDAMIEQIYVTDNKEYELIPKIGNQNILLGTMDNYKVKLSKLKAYFSQAAAAEGWTKYKTINLKFKDQVVCEKK